MEENTATLQADREDWGAGHDRSHDQQRPGGGDQLSNSIWMDGAAQYTAVRSAYRPRMRYP